MLLTKIPIEGRFVTIKSRDTRNEFVVMNVGLVVNVVVDDY